MQVDDIVRTKRIALVVILLCLTAFSDPYGTVQTPQNNTPAFAGYTGGTNLLQSPHNPSDWRKRSDLEGVFVEDDVTVEEMRFICQIPTLKVLQLGKSPEVLKLRLGVLDELVNAKKLESLSLCVESLTKDDIKVFSKMPQIRYLHLHRGPNWETFSSTTKWEPVPWNDEFGFCITVLENLETLVMSQDSKLTDAFLRRLSRCKKLSSLSISSSHFNDESLRIIGTMNLAHLSVGLPETNALSFEGLRRSTIRELAVTDLRRRRGSSVVISQRGYESLLAMKNLERIAMIEDWVMDASNGSEKIGKLKTQLAYNRERQRK